MFRYQIMLKKVRKVKYRWTWMDKWKVKRFKKQKNLKFRMLVGIILNLIK